MFNVAHGQTPTATDSGEQESTLPWNRDAIPARLPSSARELLVNVDDSELNHFVDRQPLDANDEETLDRILYRLPAIRLENVERLVRAGVEWPQLARDPQRYRADFFRLRGRVTSVARTNLLPEVAARLEFDHYFRVTLELDDAANPVVICSRKVPQAWFSDQSVLERATAYGLFIKVGDTSGAHPQLVFAAQRVAWHPDHESLQLNVGKEHVVLGDLGFDVGLLDDVRKTNFREITAVDRECFYQMLAAVGQAEPSKLLANADGEFSLISLLRDPLPHHGKLATVSGVARRVTKVLVGDRDIQQRFQLDHYYQIDMFILLGNHVIAVQSGESEKEGPQYSGVFPVTVCARRLPPGLTEGMHLRQEVRMPAFFFKVWSYKSEFVSAVDKNSSQRSPMFIALEPELIPQQNVYSPTAHLATAVLLIVASVGWFVFLWPARRNVKSKRREQSELLLLDLNKSLNATNIPPSDK